MKAATAIPAMAAQGHGRSAVIFVSSGRSARHAILERLTRAGVQVSAATDLTHAIKTLAAQPATLVLVDLAEDRAALAAIRAIATRYPAVSVAAVLDGSSPVTSGEAVQAGAFDLLPWPFSDRELLTVLANARDRLGASVAADRGTADVLVAQSPAMRTLVDRLDAALRVRAVLIAGEPGSGRRYVARLLHARWAEAKMDRVGRQPGAVAANGAATLTEKAPFVLEDCAADGPADLEHRLFGAASPNGNDGRNGKVAFERVGRDSAMFRARGGTLCLTNLPDASVRLQARLTRFMRDREAELADQPGTLVDLDVRVIVSADPSVDEAIADGRLRNDLYDRVAQARIDVPPLRARREDIPALTVRMLQDECDARSVAVKGISRAALKVLAALPWSGNVGELKVLIGLLVRSVPRQVIELDDVLEHASLDGAVVRADFGLSLREAKARFERECIAATLARHHGRVSDAARALGIQRTNLYRKVRELQVVRPRTSGRPGR